MRAQQPLRSFGELLKDYRDAAGLTQEKLAERARMSAQAVSQLERGARQRPQRSMVLLLVEALGLQGPERNAFEAAAHRAGMISAPPSSARQDDGNPPTNLPLQPPPSSDVSGNSVH